MSEWYPLSAFLGESRLLKGEFIGGRRLGVDVMVSVIRSESGRNQDSGVFL